MRKKSLLFLLVYGANFLVAQDLKPEILASAGTSNQGNTIKIDWTLGDLAISRISNSGNQITQGFHQPTLTSTRINSLIEEIGNVKIFPNPASDWLQMDLAFDKTRSVQFFLYNQEGKMLTTGKKEGRNLQFLLQLESFSAGSYFLKISVDNNIFQQSFQIQKIK